MTFHAVSTQRYSAPFRYALSQLLGWLGALASVRSEAAASGPGVALDELSEAQLQDIGIGRVARRARWLDGLEAPLPMQFDYHDRPVGLHVGGGGEHA